MSDLAVSKAGTITADEERFMEWKTKDGSYENTIYAQFDTFIDGIFDKVHILDVIRNFICFSGDMKILGAYHQYFAVRRAVSSTLKATDTLRKNRTIDWRKKESARAGMRRMIKKLLKKYKYPPQDIEDTTATVIAQCEMRMDN
ncbi:MAG: DUF3387 domain-containing protein [Helicobacteraceae bacterium]|jgi:type I restriction enzyme R subunit|nr:DUF3387 domain-containing protein [Helicobacteraceae bacterium]